MIAFFWYGWTCWLFGFEYFPKRAPQAWAYRWRLALGPFDIRWRL